MRLEELNSILTGVVTLSEDIQTPEAQHFRQLAAKSIDGRWNILVSGLRSVGKSSFVGALWGDPAMLPTAVRDCTQTNTLTRIPNPGEADRQILLSYLTREKALDYAARDLSFLRLAELILEINGPLGPKLDEMPPEQRLRSAVSTVRRIFKERPQVYVLHEPLTEELDKLEQFLEFIGSPAFKPGQTVPARWEERQEHLMGHRHPDGRTLDVGRLLALERVEMVRSSSLWNGRAPEVIDTPWIPTYHNARRADLILREAHTADLLVILALPERFELEPWAVQIFRERPELLKRTLIVFNQIDTVDTSALFSREGFATVFQENAERLAKIGIPNEQLFLSCARLPFLERGPQDGSAPQLIARLKAILSKIEKLAVGRPVGAFREKLARVCDPADAGIETLRAKLTEMASTIVSRENMRAALAAFDAIPAVDIPTQRMKDWLSLKGRMELGRQSLHSSRI